MIDMRLRKVALLPPAEATAEIGLMVTEKMEAAVHSATILMFGGTASEVVSHYRVQVANNAERLSR